MIFSENRFPPRIKSGGRLFRDHALSLTTAPFAGQSDASYPGVEAPSHHPFPEHADTGTASTTAIASAAAARSQRRRDGGNLLRAPCRAADRHRVVSVPS